MGLALAVLAAVAVASIAIFLCLFVVLFFRNPKKGMAFLASLAMLARSLFKSKASAKHHHHRRHGEVAPHDHQRTSAPRPSLMMTIRQFAIDEDETPNPPGHDRTH